MNHTNTFHQKSFRTEQNFGQIISELMEKDPAPSDLYICLNNNGRHSLTERTNGVCRAIELSQPHSNQLRDWICEYLPWAQTGDSAGSVNDRRVRVNRRSFHSGEELVLRLLPKNIPCPERLAIPDTVSRWFLSLTKGLVLFAGPTGSGKSSSIASLIKEVIHERACRLVTLEDPIEYLFSDLKSAKGFCIQRELQTHFTSFAGGLRESLRQTPDIIMVQEIRDTETAEVALSAALSGHLVVSSIHGSTVTEGLRRFGNLLGPQGDWDAFVLTLAGVISQRLLHADGPRQPLLGGSRVAGFSLLINNTGASAVLRRQHWHQVEQLLEVGEADGFLSYQRNFQDLVGQGFVRSSNSGGRHRAINTFV